MSGHSLDFLKKHKLKVDQYLQQLLQSKKSVYQEHDGAEFLFEYLHRFVTAGKTIRGALFLEFSGLLVEDGEYTQDDLLAIAAALELVHSALLIQDDYMDQDQMRRGVEALHVTLEKQAQEKEFDDTQRYSISAMICATDICFFLAYGELAKIKDYRKRELISLLIHEYIHVGFAQWKDVELAFKTKKNEVTLKEIEQVYLYKTARYTFVLPVLMAATVAGLSKKEQKVLEKAAEYMGMVFQITDDRLNIFGDPKLMGKPIGSDIIESKKTFYYYYLVNQLKKVKDEKHQQVLEYFGKKRLRQQEINKVKSALVDLKVVEMINQKIENYQQQFFELIDDLSYRQQVSHGLKTLFDYIVAREK